MNCSELFRPLTLDRTEVDRQNRTGGAKQKTKLPWIQFSAAGQLPGNACPVAQRTEHQRFSRI